MTFHQSHVDSQKRRALRAVLPSIATGVVLVFAAVLVLFKPVPSQQLPLAMAELPAIQVEPPPPVVLLPARFQSKSLYPRSVEGESLGSTPIPIVFLFPPSPVPSIFVLPASLESERIEPRNLDSERVERARTLFVLKGKTSAPARAARRLLAHRPAPVQRPAAVRRP
jgi:hypothetical protein